MKFAGVAIHFISTFSLICAFQRLIFYMYCEGDTPLAYCVPFFFGIAYCVPPFFGFAYCVPFNNKKQPFWAFLST